MAAYYRYVEGLAAERPWEAGVDAASRRAHALWEERRDGEEARIFMRALVRCARQGQRATEALWDYDAERRRLLHGRERGPWHYRDLLQREAPALAALPVEREQVVHADEIGHFAWEGWPVELGLDLVWRTPEGLGALILAQEELLLPLRAALLRLWARADRGLAPAQVAIYGLCWGENGRVQSLPEDPAGAAALERLIRTSAGAVSRLHAALPGRASSCEGCIFATDCECENRE